jgi:hypothetical protein
MRENKKLYLKGEEVEMLCDCGDCAVIKPINGEERIVSKKRITDYMGFSIVNEIPDTHFAPGDKNFNKKYETKGRS